MRSSRACEAYDQQALLEKIAINRKLLAHWTVEHRPVGRAGGDQPGGCRPTAYNLVGVPLSVKFDNTNSLLDPTRGFRAALLLTPTQSFGQSSATFVIAQLVRFGVFRPQRRGTQRRRAARPGRQGLRRRAVRPAARPALLCRRLRHGARLSLPVGRAAVPGRQSDRRHGGQRRISRVPPADSRQLRRGGVRRCRARSPRTARRSPATGVSGAGIGVRYYTSIGPIRLDVAVPLNREPGGDAFELYIGIGQAF